MAGPHWSASSREIRGWRLDRLPGLRATFTSRAEASFVVSFPNLIRVLGASGCARLRQRPYGALVAATGAIIVFVVAIAMVLQTASRILTEDPVKNFRVASHAYVECSRSAAAQLASKPEIPELIAIAALKQCAGEAERSRELAIPIAGEVGSLHIMLEVDDLLRENARTIVVAIREQAGQFQDDSQSALPAGTDERRKCRQKLGTPAMALLATIAP